MTTPASPPRVTVLFPVYNGEQYLREALESLLTQTFPNFSLLAIDDGSTDSSLEILRSIKDPRLSVKVNPTNRGLINTLNEGLELVQSEYVARMDADDIATPYRLEEQLAFMDAHPDVGLCGGYYERFTDTESIVVRPPTTHEDISYALIFDNVMAHNTVMFRRSVLERYRLRYDPAFAYAEDYELWVRFARYSRLANLPRVLVRYRFHPANTSSRFKTEQEATAAKVRHIHRANLGLEPQVGDALLHRQLFDMRFEGDLRQLNAAGTWLSKLYRIGVWRCRQNPVSLFVQFNRLWYSACGKLADDGLTVFLQFLRKPYGMFGNPLYTLKLAYRCWKRTKIA
ncbi:glycosyltransferase [Methylococcus geothermalis]|uniref:Glycosyltransferase n=1 Tax=Methylococcus geothermalis TaxID=2681310 RepID=A0A858QB58_9GAMM|nr:glycosyltransferase [Methylococcus geothermalis]QJD31129.1 glycosyltransferase [Methylococcus geothermalis]